MQKYKGELSPLLESELLEKALVKLNSEELIRPEFFSEMGLPKDYEDQFTILIEQLLRAYMRLPNWLKPNLLVLGDREIPLTMSTSLLSEALIDFAKKSRDKGQTELPVNREILN